MKQPNTQKAVLPKTTQEESLPPLSDSFVYQETRIFRATLTRNMVEEALTEYVMKMAGSDPVENGFYRDTNDKATNLALSFEGQEFLEAKIKFTMQMKVKK